MLKYLSMKRKTFAVCISGYHPQSDVKILNQLIANCKRNDINVLVFTSLMIKGDFPQGIDLNKNLVRGESEIFNLINYNIIDGLFLFGNSIFRKETVKEIQKRCEKHKIPLININNPADVMSHNVTLKNGTSMELILEHLITVHELTRINFIGGIPDESESEERLESYKNVLGKYNIPVEESRIDYGYFWKESIECAKRFLKKDVPQAIVCANDKMAIFVADYLKSEGYKVPEDIIVTGFDGTKDADSYTPRITTVRPKYAYAGDLIYKMMIRLVMGEQNIDDICVDAELIVQESCGCSVFKKQFYNFVHSEYEEKNIVNLFHKRMVSSDIHLSDEVTPDELFEHLSYPLTAFSFKSFIFCIDEALSTENEYFFKSNAKRYGMPAKVRAVVPYYRKYTDNEIFPSKELLWYNFLDEDESTIRFFMPLYYKNHCLGYMVSIPDGNPDFNADMFILWAFSASEKVGGYFLKKELELLNSKDHLTGLYNRRGMEKYFAEVYDTIVRNEEYVSIVCIDIDFLKMINDKFGHEHGDNAIVQTSDAIKKVFSHNSICVRTGGDEFCVVTHSKAAPELENQIDELNKLLDEYNKTSGLEYKINCSSGFFTLFSKDFSSFEEMQRIADANLYEVKSKHHHRRKTDLMN